MNTRKLSLLVKDIDSEESACAIKNNLSKMGGLNKVSVFFISKMILLEYDRDSVTLEKIISRINSLGYGVDKVLESEKNKMEFKFFDSNFRKKLFLKFIVSFFVSVIILYSNYLNVEGITSFILAFFVWIYCGFDFHKKFLKNIGSKFDIDALVSVSSAFGMILNSLIIFYPSLLSDINPRWYEVTLLISIFNLGKYLDSFVSERYQEYFNLMIKIYPKFATIIKNDKSARVESEKIEPGDLLYIKKGEQIPSDCVLESREALIDESVFTGQSGYVKKKRGDTLYATTVNVYDDIKAVALKRMEDTVFMQIAAITRDSYIKREIMRNSEEKTFRYYFFSFLFLSFSFSFFLYLKTDFSFALYSFMYMIMLASPLSLGILFPISTLIGFTRASKTGFVFNNPEVINRIGSINLMIFDIASIPDISDDYLDIMKKNFNEYNIKPVIASSETKEIVSNFALKLGIDEYYFNVKPQEKHSIVLRYRMDGYKVMMVGDGLNDTPAILNSDLGVAVKRGIDITSISSDMVLIKPDILLIFKAMDLTKKINSIISQNFKFSLSLAFLSAFACFFSLKNPYIFSIVFMFSAFVGVIGVLLNSIRLYKIRLEGN
ncbi:MAG: HAD-IC family P-type ATPase [Elusimicrobiales bacterium]